MRLSRSPEYSSTIQSTLAASLTLMLMILLTACAGEDGGNSETTLFFSDSRTTTPTTTPTTDTTGTTDTTDTTVVRNNPALITGSDNASITEDIDVDSDGFLRSSGKLEITDSDAGESSFKAVNISNAYGSFSLDSTGNWNFAADNSLSEIQSLAGGRIETLELTVNSADNTVHIITIRVIGTDDPAIITGIDSGEVTEDLDPDGDNLLEAAGKLEIIDTDTGESAFVTEEITGSFGRLNIASDGNWNYSVSNILLDIQKLTGIESMSETFTVKNAGGTTHDIIITINGDEDITEISGDDEATLTEDVDPDNNDLLEASGILNITDGDSELTVFVADNISGLYGNFTIDTDGHWTYAADNTQSTIDDLANGIKLIENITVYSNNGVSHDVVITIDSFDISLAWIAPVTREDNTTPISLPEIGGYRIYYGITPGDYQQSVEITDSNEIEQTIKGLGAGTYYLVMTTFDTDNRESLYSPEIVLSNK